MRFVAYRTVDQVNPKNASIGVVIQEKVAPLTTIDEFYADIEHWKLKASEITAGSLPIAGLVLAVPVPTDAKIFCAAINYVKHGKEGGLPTPTFPNLFARWTAELVVDGTPVPVPLAEPDGLDWEVELAAIVGRTATDVSEAQGQDCVFGYTVANDISARGSQLQAVTLSTGQWALGKNPEKSGVIGSFVETADGVDADNIKLETIVDGTVMQSGSTTDMVFSVGAIIAFASRHVTLRPGDLILTGTPDGVGLGRNPRIYMKPGASVTVSAEGLCSVTNPIVDHTHRG